MILRWKFLKNFPLVNFNFFFFGANQMQEGIYEAYFRRIVQVIIKLKL